MKSVKLIAVVFSLHIFVVLALLMQPGCQSMQNRHASSKTVTINEYLKEPVHEDFNAGMSSDTPLRAHPMRPVSTQEVVKSESGQIEEEFIVDILEPLKMLDQPTQTAGKGSEPSDSPEYLANTTYEVKRGDNLWIIAKKTGVASTKIAKANNLQQDTILQIGQKLTIPGASQTQLAQAPSTSVATQVATGDVKEYLVQRGDTLSTIASKMQSSVASIKSANNLRSNVIYVGQKLKVPSNTPATTLVAQQVTTPKPTNQNFEATYKVRPGQTLSDIAQVTGVKVTHLMSYNNISDPRTLRAGQELKLTGTQQATVASASTKNTVTAPKVVPQGSTSESSTQVQETVADLDKFFDSTEEIPWVSVESAESAPTA